MTSTQTNHSPKPPVMTVVASFIIMLCLGGIYAWSIFVPELYREYNWTTVQTQLVFGTVILIFPATMIFAGQLQHRLSPRTQALLSGIFFGGGYLLSGYSGGNFLVVLLGTGILAGIGTGFGYLTALTVPVKWFPEKKGLITGIVTAGFGLAAVVLTYLTEHALNDGKTVMEIFQRIGWSYGAVIFTFALFIRKPGTNTQIHLSPIQSMLGSGSFYLLFTGIFFGTFAGLLVLGNLSPIGAEHGIDTHTLMVGVSVFAVSNFAGRLFWGWLSDYFSTRLCIPIALSLQAVGIFLLGYLALTGTVYIALAIVIGFGFGSNFVLFAKESAHQFGLANLASIYPYIFMGYAIAGIVGPLTGGYMYDQTASYHYASYVAAAMSMAGALLFFVVSKKK